MRNINEITHANWWDLREVKTLKNGAYSYMETGNPDKPALIMVHGFGNSGRVWKRVMENLADDYHLIAVDIRGAGKSAVSDMFAYPIANQAKDIIELMDALGIEKTYMAGHSIGSIITQAVAMAAPERVIKGVLIASFARMHQTPEEIKAMYEQFTGEGDDDRRYSEASEYPDQEGFRYQMEDRAKLPKQFFTSTWWGMTMTDHRCFLQFIKSPMLMIWGSEDVINGLQRQELIDGLAGNDVIIYEGIGHEVPSREPDRLAGDIRAFCR